MGLMSLSIEVVPKLAKRASNVQC